MLVFWVFEDMGSIPGIVRYKYNYLKTSYERFDFADFVALSKSGYDGHNIDLMIF